MRLAILCAGFGNRRWLFLCLTSCSRIVLLLSQNDQIVRRGVTMSGKSPDKQSGGSNGDASQ
jgi:hypothetical protein